MHTGFSLVVESRGYSLVLVGGLLIAVASLVEHRLQSAGLRSCVAGASLPRNVWNLPGAGIESLSLLCQADS